MAVRKYQTYKSHKFQNKVKPAAHLHQFVRQYGIDASSKLLDYSVGALYAFMRDGAPQWLDNRCRDLLEKYRELRMSGRVPEFTHEEVGNPDRFVKVMINDFPDTMMGMALKRAYEEAKANFHKPEPIVEEVAGPTPGERFVEEVLHSNDKPHQPQETKEVLTETEQPVRRDKLGRPLTPEHVDRLKSSLAKARATLAAKRAAKRATLEAAGAAAAAKEEPKPETVQVTQRREQLLANLAKANAARAAKRAAVQEEVKEKPPVTVAELDMRPMGMGNKARAVKLLGHISTLMNITLSGHGNQMDVLRRLNEMMALTTEMLD